MYVFNIKRRIFVIFQFLNSFARTKYHIKTLCFIFLFYLLITYFSPEVIKISDLNIQFYSNTNKTCSYLTHKIDFIVEYIKRIKSNIFLKSFSWKRIYINLFHFPGTYYSNLAVYSSYINIYSFPLNK